MLKLTRLQYARRTRHCKAPGKKASWMPIVGNALDDLSPGMAKLYLTIGIDRGGLPWVQRGCNTHPGKARPRDMLLEDFFLAIPGLVVAIR